MRSSVRPALALTLWSACVTACTAASPRPGPAPSTSASASANARSSASPSASALASAAPTLSDEERHPPPPAPSPPLRLAGGGKHAVRGERGVVTSVEAHASKVGAAVLDKGGNAVDAAVAAAFVLAVTHPSAGNLGGGGFMLVRPASGETVAIDFRELAPAAATQAKNDAQVAAGAVGWLSIAVPGSVAGLALAHAKHGSLPWADVVAPARDLAKKGHKLAARQAATIAWSWSKLSKDPEAKKIFGRGKGPKKEGELVVQPDLAKVLDAIARDGAKGFYEGWVADAIARAAQKHGGLITKQDLASYRAKVRAPLTVGYRGFVVETMPPPSMGGVAVAEMLRVLERTKAHEAPPDTGLGLHWFVEASRRAFAERRLVGADPDARERETREQLGRLLSNVHAHKLATSIDPAQATPSSRISLDMALDPFESPDTTHLSVVDQKGNAVSLTTTLSAGFGAKVIAPGTGVVFNNAMGAFSPSGPNQLAPGKRMASSMTPTIVSQGGKLALVLGSPGGDTIPNTVVQVLRNAVDYGMTIDRAVAAPRVHTRLFPAEVRFEPGNRPPKAALDDLSKRGHTVVPGAYPIGDANNVLIDQAGVAWAVSDAREGGRAVAAR